MKRYKKLKMEVGPRRLMSWSDNYKAACDFALNRAADNRNKNYVVVSADASEIAQYAVTSYDHVEKTAKKLAKVIELAHKSGVIDKSLAAKLVEAAEVSELWKEEREVVFYLPSTKINVMIAQMVPVPDWA